MKIARRAPVSDPAPIIPLHDRAIATARELQFAQAGQTIVIAAGMPFGTSGSTNLLRIAQVL